MTIISQLNNGVQQEMVLVHKRYIDETAYFDNHPLTSEPTYRKLFVSLPGSGKTTYVANAVKEAYDHVLILADTVTAGRQLAHDLQLPFHCAATPVDPSKTPKVVTIYNHIGLFADPRRTVVVDEAHSLIVQRSFRAETIDTLTAYLDAFDRVIYLTGTHIDSRDWAGVDIIRFVQTERHITPLTLVPYDADVHGRSIAEVVATLAATHINDGRQIFINLPDKSARLTKLVEALHAVGITSITTLNADTVNREMDIDCLEVIEQQRFSSKVLVSSYSQGYSLLNENVVYISYPNVDYVNLVQSIARVRTPLTKAYFLTNATEVSDSMTFDDAWANAFNEVFQHAVTAQQAEAAKARSERHLRVCLKSNPYGHLVRSRHEFDWPEIAMHVVHLVSQQMAKDITLLKDLLTHFGIAAKSRVTRLETLPTDYADIAPTNAAKDAILTALNGGSLVTRRQHEAVERFNLLVEAGATKDEARQSILERYKSFNNELLRFKVRNGEYPLLNQLMAAQVKMGEFYTSKQLEDIVSAYVVAAGLSDKKCDKRFAFAILDGLYDVERVGKRVNGEYVKGYVLAPLTVKQHRVTTNDTVVKLDDDNDW